MKQIIVICVILQSVWMLNGSTIHKQRKPENYFRKLLEKEICDLEDEIKEKIRKPRFCPEGQLPDHNGKCRDIWLSKKHHLCPLCPEGQLLDQNDKCRDVWLFNAYQFCPEGQLPDQNGKCRDIWRLKSRHCPEGQRPDQNGKCRDVWVFNIIGAPNVCPDGYRYQDGKCRRLF